MPPVSSPKRTVHKLNLDHFNLDRYWPDVFIIIGIVLLGGTVSYLGFQMIDPALHQDFTEDIWFGSDIERVIRNISDRSQSFRSGVHPLFPLLVYPFVFGIQTLTGLEPIAAIQILNAVTTGLWIGSLWLILRLIGCYRIDAILYCLLVAVSAAVLFWTVVPESYLFGSLSLIVPMGLVALSRYQKLPKFLYVIASAFSLSITTTNWMSGIAAAVVTFSRRVALWITIQSLVLVSLFWLVQKRYFPRAEFFFGSDIIQEELKYANPHSSGGPIRIFSGLIFNSLIIPEISTSPSNRGLADWPLLTVQFSAPGSGSPWGLVAVLLWAILLVIGIWALFSSNKVNARFRNFLLLVLAGQFLLHSVYGNETFLYAIHILPFLIVLATFANQTHFRLFSLALVSALILLTALNNIQQFNNATEFLKNTGPLREQSVSLFNENTDSWVDLAMVSAQELS